MFPTFDSKFFEQFSLAPGSFLSKMADFQRANFEAAREIAETNAKAFQELAAIRDPKEFASLQQAILQATIQKNTDTLTKLWASLSDDVTPDVKPPAPKKK